jgi:hypothetical protein
MRMRSRQARPQRPHTPGTSIPGDLLLAVEVSTPAETLAALVERYIGTVRPDSNRPQTVLLRALARHPNLAADDLAALSDDYPYQVLENPALARYRAAAPGFLGWLEASVQEEPEVFQDEADDLEDDGIPF